MTFYLFPLLILFFQNLIIFWNHYFNKIIFNWDFSLGYFAIPAFWTTAVSQGIFPQWIPFQSMGYPLFMNAQSGFFYPFLWIFPLFSIPYTLDAAVIFQVLHVFFGSVGMFFFLKFLFKSPKYAIVGAIAFQFFGGFYANSEHVDIVRAFAISPWMFYVFTVNIEKPTFSHRILFIPIVIYLLATGAYPGNFISSIFVMSLFVILQGINGIKQGIRKRKSVLISGSLFGLLLLGMIISSIHLGPIFQNQDELTRFNFENRSVRHNIFEVEEFPGLFMSNNPIPGEISMHSTFITLPILIFASFTPFHMIKKYWIFLVILVFAALMVLGNQTFFWKFIVSIFPILEVSRFLSNDYRIFLAIPLIVFGIIGLKWVIEGKFAIKAFFFRIPFILLWFSFGLFSLYSNSSGSRWTNLEFLNQQIIFSILILISTISVLAYFGIKQKNRKMSSWKKPIEFSMIALIIFGSIIIIDGSRVISDMISWRLEPSDSIYAKNNYQLEKDGKLITYSIFENIPTERPEREITKSVRFFSWIGYLDGSYMMQDIGNTVLKPREIVESNNNYTNFMLMRWTPLIVDPNTKLDNSRISLSEKLFSTLDSKTKENSVVQTYYGINDISYQVSLKEPKLMIENEIYFPGWKATLIFPDKEVEIDALVTNEVFRSWLLPAGDYEMKANFQFPNLILYQITSITAFVIWISLVIIYWRKNAKYTTTI